jgi:hypothetical protein
VNASGRLKVSLKSCNITGHFHDAAIAVFVDSNSDVTIDNCVIWENYNGAIHFGPFSNSDMKVAINFYFDRKSATINRLNEFCNYKIL